MAGRRFNVTGLCTPEQDYMADISARAAWEWVDYKGKRISDIVLG